MVIDLKKYQCGFNECNNIFDTPEKAQECEEQGLIGDGPVIEPGLVVKIYKNFYSVYFQEKHDGHRRLDNFINLRKNSKRLWNFKKVYLLHLEESYSLTRKHLNHIKNRGDITLLDEKEFFEFKNLLSEKNIVINIFESKKISESEGEVFKKIYRYHPYFDKSITQ